MNPITEQEMPIFKEDSAEIETLKECTGVADSYSEFSVELPQMIPYQELTDEEVLALSEKAGTFDFYYDPEEDIYSPSDGTPI